MGFRVKNTSRYILAVVVVVLSVACKSKQQDEPTQSAKPTAQVETSNTLVQDLPRQTVGFMYGSLEHPAYKKLMTSPWGSSSSTWMQVSKNNPELAELQKTLASFGIDLSKPEELGSVIAEYAVFVAPSESAEEAKAIEDREIPFGLLFRSPSKEEMKKFRSNLQEQLQKSEATYEEIAVSDAEGTEAGALKMVFTPAPRPEAPKPEEVVIYFHSTEDKGLFSLSESLLTLFDGQSESAPAILDTTAFTAATKGLGSEKGTYNFGYIDVVAVFAESKQFLEEMDKNAAENEKFLTGIESIAWASSMFDSPEQEMRVRLTDGGAEAVKGLGAVKGETISRFLPTSPMAVMTFDVGFFHKAFSSVEEQTPTAQMVEAQAPWLKEVKKLAIALSASKPGILPVPNIAISMQVADTEAVVEFLKTSLIQAVAMSGMAPNPEWKDAEHDGVGIASMMGPMGLSLNLASKDGVVLLANNLEELKSVVGTSGVKPTALIAKTTAPAQVMTMNLDFVEVAKFMETMGGVLSMYAPQDETTKEMLSEESIAVIRNMGDLALTLEKKDKMFVLQSKYHAKKNK